MRRRALLAPALVGILLLTGCTSSGMQAPDHDVDGLVSEWDHPTSAPVEFSGPTTAGSTYRSTAERGHVQVVNFWYQDCPPCNAEAPILRSLSAKYAKQGVRFVGVNVQDEKEAALSFERQYRLTYPSILDDQNGGAVRLAFQATVQPTAIPSTVVLDRDGRVTARLTGQVNRSVLDTLIDKALTGKGA